MINAGQLVDTILSRARDPQGLATSPAACLSLTSTVQQVINGMVGDVIVQAPLTLQPFTTIYQLSAYLPAAMRVHALEFSTGENLDYLSGGIDELAWIDLSWVSRVSDEPRCWTQVGRDLLVVYPGIRAPLTLTAVFTQLTPPLASLADDATVVQQETDYAIMTLTEMLLLLKTRDYGPLKGTFERFQRQLDELRSEER